MRPRAVEEGETWWPTARHGRGSDPRGDRHRSPASGSRSRDDPFAAPLRSARVGLECRRAAASNATPRGRPPRRRGGGRRRLHGPVGGAPPGRARRGRGGARRGRTRLGRIRTQRRAGHPGTQGRSRRAGEEVRPGDGPADVADHRWCRRFRLRAHRPPQDLLPGASVRLDQRGAERGGDGNPARANGAVAAARRARGSAGQAARRGADRHHVLRGRHARPARRSAPAAGLRARARERGEGSRRRHPWAVGGDTARSAGGIMARGDVRRDGHREHGDPRHQRLHGRFVARAQAHRPARAELPGGHTAAAGGRAPARVARRAGRLGPPPHPLLLPPRSGRPPAHGRAWSARRRRRSRALRPPGSGGGAVLPSDGRAAMGASLERAGRAHRRSSAASPRAAARRADRTRLQRAWRGHGHGDGQAAGRSRAGRLCRRAGLAGDADHADPAPRLASARHGAGGPLEALPGLARHARRRLTRSARACYE